MNNKSNKTMFNKIIPASIAICIILIFAITVGGFTWWQHATIQETKEGPEIKLPEKEESMIIGKLVKLGHPFSGWAILSDKEYYILSGEKALEILDYEENSEFEIIGVISEQERTIPEAGDFAIIKEKIIEVSSYKILENGEDKTTD